MTGVAYLEIFEYHAGKLTTYASLKTLELKYCKLVSIRQPYMPFDCDYYILLLKRIYIASCYYILLYN